MIDETKEDLVLRAGEWVTCEAGHRICRSKIDQPRHGAAEVAHFEKWHVDEPKPGDRLTKCWCGALYVKTIGRPGVMAIHREDRGWS